MRSLKYKAYIREYDRIVEVEQLELLANGEVQSIVVEDWELTDKTYRFTQGQFNLMQYIGVKDIHNIEIYEGYIVKVIPAYGHGARIGKVIYYEDKACFLIETTECDYFTFMSQDLKSVEILGNIYENKGLLDE